MRAESSIAVGHRLDPLVVESVDAGRMKTVAAILHDPNPIHYDADVVRQLGFGDRPVNQGPLTMAYLLELVSHFAGGPEAILRFRARFLGNVFAGDRVVCTGTVTALDEHERIAELDVQATVDDQAVLAGSATIRLQGGAIS